MTLSWISLLYTVVNLCWAQNGITSSNQIQLSLNGQWKVANSNGSVTIPATIPGGIYTDLMKSGVIGDPYYRDNDVLYRWVGRDKWTFKRTFTVSAEMLSKKRIILVSHGLDTVATVNVNGLLAGTGDNMFSRYVFDIKDILMEGENTIEVAFDSAVDYALQKNLEQQKNYVIPPTCPPPIQKGECHVNFIRKIQSSFSWDWGPSFPSQGIWKDIEIVAFDGAILRDVTVFATESNTGHTNDKTAWKIESRIFLETASQETIKGTVRIALDERLIYSNMTTIVPDTHQETMINISVAVPITLDIQRWWPSGYGDQNLYKLEITFIDETSGEESYKAMKIGFRTLELVQMPIANATGETFFVKVNGVELFAKGSNWIPADSFPERITESYTRRLLQSAKDANMNMLRVWGGGMYETEAFYGIADELGILIWQDIMFAVALYPTDTSFLQSVAIEVKQQVRRIQHHPSVLLWAGNNENEAGIAETWWPQVKKSVDTYKSDYRTLYITKIMPIVMNEDPGRSFISSSPSNGKETRDEEWIAKDPQDQHWGDVHFYNYTSDSWDWKSYPVPRFASEYGFQSFPSFETIQNVSISSDWTYPLSAFINHRQHSILGGLEIISSVKRHLFLPTLASGEGSFKDMLYLSQIAQAVSIKTESEHYRRRRNEIDSTGRGKTMGALYWQLNDIWQAPSWASTEYGGKWKMLQYFAKEFFAPVLVSPYKDNNTLNVYVVSDELSERTGFTLRVSVYSWSSLEPSLDVVIKNFTQNPQTSVLVYSALIESEGGLLLKAKCKSKNDCFIYTRLMDSKNEQLSTNFVLLDVLNKSVGLRKANLQITDVSSPTPKTFVIQLSTDTIAPFVWLNAEGIKGEFSRNGFFMVDSSANIDFLAVDDIDINVLKNKLSIRSLMDVVQ